MTLEFSIWEQTISLVRPQSRQTVVANSQNYLRAGFSFSEEWTGIITAVFEHPTAGAKAVLVGSDGTCLVPWEVIQPPCFSVGVFCGNRVTSNRAQVFVQESVSLDTEATADPTPTVYEQIIALLENAGTGTGGTGSITSEKDPTVPSWVKSILKTDIERWNNPPVPDLSGYLTDTAADAAYQPIGEYATQDDLTGLLTKSDADGAYQPVGEYATPDDLTGLITKADADKAYQAKGTYLQKTDALDLSKLRDYNTDNVYGAATSGLASNSVNRLLYYKSDTIANADEVYRTGAYGVDIKDTHMPYLQYWYLLCFCKNETMKICVQWAFPVRPECNGELWLRTCRGEDNFFGEWKRVALAEQVTALEARVAALETAKN